MKPKKVLNSFDQSSESIIEAMSAVNDPECQFNSRDLDIFMKNLEMLRDNYLELTESGFSFEVSDALEQTKHHLNVDWISRDALLNNYEVNLR